MNAAKAAKTSGGNTRTAKIRHLDLLRGADHHVFDLTFAIEENTDLPSGFVRDLGHLPCKLLRNDLAGCNTSRAELFNAAYLIML